MRQETSITPDSLISELYGVWVPGNIGNEFEWKKDTAAPGTQLNRYNRRQWYRTQPDEQFSLSLHRGEKKHFWEKRQPGTIEVKRKTSFITNREYAVQTLSMWQANIPPSVLFTHPNIHETRTTTVRLHTLTHLPVSIQSGRYFSFRSSDNPNEVTHFAAVGTILECVFQSPDGPQMQLYLPIGAYDVWGALSGPTTVRKNADRTEFSTGDDTFLTLIHTASNPDIEQKTNPDEEGAKWWIRYANTILRYTLATQISVTSSLPQFSSDIVRASQDHLKRM